MGGDIWHGVEGDAKHGDAFHTKHAGLINQGLCHFWSLLEIPPTPLRCPSPTLFPADYQSLVSMARLQPVTLHIFVARLQSADRQDRAKSIAFTMPSITTHQRQRHLAANIWIVQLLCGVPGALFFTSLCTCMALMLQFASAWGCKISLSLTKTTNFQRQRLWMVQLPCNVLVAFF